MPIEITEARRQRLRTLQWSVVAGWIVMFGASLVLRPETGPAGFSKGFGCVVGLLTSLAHGLWITIDAHIKEREVSGWRFGAFFLGPIVLWIWFLVAYGPKKAVLLIPLSIVVYAIPFAQVMAAALLGLVSLEE